jgi:uncharacterized protein (TIGR00369 family)
MDPRLREVPYPFQELIGFRMADWSADYARFELDVTDAILNRHGIPHGGVHAVLLDTVMGYAGCFTGDPDDRVMAMTLSMTANYLSRPKGSLLIAEGRKTGGGKSTFFASGRVEDETGELVATSTGVFRYRKG